MPTDRKSAGSNRKLIIAGVIAGMVAIGIVAHGVISRMRSHDDLVAWTDRHATPTVLVTQPDEKAIEATLELPGRLEAYSQAPIFARVSGYLKSWSADMGTPVKAGQVIGEIEAPDLDTDELKNLNLVTATPAAKPSAMPGAKIRS